MTNSEADTLGLQLLSFFVALFAAFALHSWLGFELSVILLLILILIGVIASNN